MKERILSLVLTFVMAVSLFTGMAPMEVNAETTGIDYNFSYAYDCQRSPAYPTKGSTVTMRGFTTPIGASETSGDWELIDCGKYDSSIHTEVKATSIASIVSSLSSRYGISNSEIKVYELKKDGAHICYGVVCTMFDDGVLFIGTTHSGGAGYYLCNTLLSTSDRITDEAIGDTNNPTPVGPSTPGYNVIENLESLVTVNGKTVSFNLDPSKQYIVQIAEVDDAQLNSVYASACEQLMDAVGKNVLAKGDFTTDTVSAHVSNPDTYGARIVGVSSEQSYEIVSSHSPVTITDGGYIAIAEVDSDDKIIYEDNNGYSGDYYISYGLYALYIPAEGSGGEQPPTSGVKITLNNDGLVNALADACVYTSEGENVGEFFTAGTEVFLGDPTNFVKVFVYTEDWEKLPEGTKITVTAGSADVTDVVWTDEGFYYCEVTNITEDTEIVISEVEEEIEAPAITGQPKNATVEDGQKATFTVTTTADDLDYQWMIDRNDGKGFVKLDSTTATHTTTVVDMSCNGFKYKCIVSNSAGSVTSNVVTLTVTEKEVVHTHDLTLVSAKAATCKEAGNKTYYTCLGCDSLFTDAEGTKTTTAEAVKIAALGHEWSGEWTIIKEATATEEGKKETYCTRKCGQKKVAVIPIEGEEDEDAGNIEKDAEVDPEASVDEATIDNKKDELLEGDIFTAEEKELIEAGEEARVWLEIGKTDEDAIAADDKAKIEKEAADIMGDDAKITYFDADLFKKVGNGERTEIIEPGMDIEITIVIPDELLNQDETIVREYKIIRLHDGEVDVISGTFDAATGEFSFKTDRFSTYAIVYDDVPVDDADDKDDVPDTGVVSVSSYAAALTLISGLGLVFCSSKKKITNKEN